MPKKKLRLRRGWVPVNGEGCVIWNRARPTRTLVIERMGGPRYWRTDRANGWRMLRCCVEDPKGGA